MKTTTISIRQDSKGILKSYPREIDLGTIDDKNTRALLFERTEDYAEYDLVLRFYVEGVCVSRVNLGRGNTFSLPNELMRSRCTRMNIRFQLGSLFRESAGDVNLLLRSFKEPPYKHDHNHRDSHKPHHPHRPDFGEEILEELEHSAHVGELDYVDGVLSAFNMQGDIISSVIIADPTEPQAATIDDDNCSGNATWSSEKIEAEIETSVIKTLNNLWGDF